MSDFKQLLAFIILKTATGTKITGQKSKQFSSLFRHGGLMRKEKVFFGQVVESL